MLSRCGGRSILESKMVGMAWWWVEFVWRRERFLKKISFFFSLFLPKTFPWQIFSLDFLSRKISIFFHSFLSLHINVDSTFKKQVMASGIHETNFKDSQ